MDLVTVVDDELVVDKQIGHNKWDPRGVHTRLLWRDTIPMFAAGPLIGDEMVYRGCKYLQHVASKLEDSAAAGVEILNPVHVGMLMHVRTAYWLMLVCDAYLMRTCV